MKKGMKKLKLNSTLNSIFLRRCILNVTSTFIIVNTKARRLLTKMISSGSEKLSMTWRTEFLGPHLLANIAGAGGSCTCLTTESALPSSKAVVGLFFSALWCPPCEQFLKDLLLFYENIKATQPDFEIVLISSDKDDKQFSRCKQ